MRAVWILSVLLIVGASTAWAGSIGDPVPANPCAGAAAFKSKLAVLDVTSDGAAFCAGFANADTAITCTIKEPDASGSADLIIEYYDEFGGAMNAPPLGLGLDQQCGVPPGSSFTFTLSPLPAGPGGFGPWAAGIAFPGPLPLVAPGSPSCGGAPGCALHGFARIFSTSKKIQCTGTRIDTQAHCFGLNPTPFTTKNLTVIKSPKQKGD